MTNNDILRRIRYCFDINDKKMMALFALSGQKVTIQQLHHWLKKDDDADFVRLNDFLFASFLNAFIEDKRGKKPGAAPKIEKKLTNNIILTKLKIALNLQSDDIIALLASVDFSLGKAELSALFRKPEHKHFRECKDQILRNFLNALQNKYRQDSSSESKSKQSIHHKKRNDNDKATTLHQVKPNASKRFNNPKAQKSTTQSSGKTLSLPSKEIWKNSPQ